MPKHASGLNLPLIPSAHGFCSRPANEPSYADCHSPSVSLTLTIGWQLPHGFQSAGAAASQVPPGAAVLLWRLLLEQWCEQAAIWLAVKAAHKSVFLRALPQVYPLEHLPSRPLLTAPCYLQNIFHIILITVEKPDGFYRGGEVYLSKAPSHPAGNAPFNHSFIQCLLIIAHAC